MQVAFGGHRIETVAQFRAAVDRVVLEGRDGLQVLGSSPCKPRMNATAKRPVRKGSSP